MPNHETRDGFNEMQGHVNRFSVSEQTPSIVQI